jgi:predicted Zn-dependent protease
VLVAPAALAQQPAAWPGGAFNPYGHVPILVFVDASNLTQTTQPYVDTVRTAWAWWEAGGNGGLHWTPRFNETTSREQADIVVWFVETSLVSCGSLGAGQGCGGFGGPAYATRQGEVWLATEIRSAGGETSHIPYEEMRRVAEHELGHALGLPHSTNPADVMYPESKAVTHGDSPDSILTQRETLVAAGIVLGGIVILVGAQRVRHAILSARNERRWRRARDEAARPLGEVEIRVTGGSGLYVRQGRCARAPDGEHRFEARELVVDGAATTWMVCRLCRYPKKL